MITASALERLEACPASSRLPQSPYAGEAAEVGTENHRVIEEVIDAGGVPEALADLWEGATSVGTEQAYVIDVETRESTFLRKLPVAREYGALGPTQIGMTLDVVLTRPDEDIIIDWKSRKRVTPAARNLQVIAQACAVEGERGVSGWAGLVYLDNWERDLAPFSSFDSDARWSRLENIVRKVEAEKTTPTTPRMGSHCEYCPALLSCPSQKMALASISGEEMPIETMPAQRVGELYERLKTVGSMLEIATQAIKLRAKREPIPLPNGKRLGLVESHTTRQDAKAMASRLKELGVDQEEFRKTSYYTQLKELKGE